MLGIRRDAVRLTWKSLFRLLVVIGIFGLALMALVKLDDLQKDGHERERGAITIDGAFLLRLKNLDHDAYRAAGRLFRKGKTAWPTEDLLLDALAQEKLHFDTKLQEKIKLYEDASTALDTLIPSQAETVAKAKGLVTLQGAVARMAGLVQSRAANAQSQRMILAEAVPQARAKIEVLRPFLNPTSSGEHLELEGPLQTIRKRLINDRDPVHVAYAIGWYTALLIVVMSLAYLIWMLILRGLPFPGSYEHFDKKLPDFLKRDAPTGGSLAGRALAALAATAIGAATVAEGVARFDSSPLNEAPITISTVADGVSQPEPPPPYEFDTRALTDRLDALRESVEGVKTATDATRSDVTNSLASVTTAVTGVAGAVESFRMSAVPVLEESRDASRETAGYTRNLPPMNERLQSVQRSSDAIQRSTSNLGPIRTAVEKLPDTVDKSARNAAQGATEAITREVDASKVALTTETQNTLVQDSVYSSHRWWRKLLWLEKYDVSPIALTTIERAVNANDKALIDAVKLVQRWEPLHRVIFLNQIEASFPAGTSPETRRDYMKRYTPLLLSACRTYE